MHAAALALALVASPIPPGVIEGEPETKALATRHKADFPYPQLPPEILCDLCVKQCEQDIARITAQLKLVGGDCWDTWGGSSVGTAGGGWRAQCLRDMLREAERRKQIFYACHWVCWPSATPDQREEWVDRLVDLIGFDAFCRGEIPLPLGAFD